MIQTGLDQIRDKKKSLIKGRRIALLANQASCDQRLVQAKEVIKEAGGILKVILAPEHGFYGDYQDMEPVLEEFVDNIRVFSLYQEDFSSLSPSEEMFSEVDVLVIDLQDVGTRYYTFVWTALLCLRLCARIGKEVIVLDRPNPLGGIEVEGGLIEPGFESFVGLWSVSIRHGLTLGELLWMVAKNERINSPFIVLMEGWSRGMSFPETGLFWIPPSPNMSCFESAFLYPGLCLFEATNISEGRGTCFPFQVIGAPFIDSERLITRLSKFSLRGVRFMPYIFRPCFHKFRHERCKGVRFFVTDPLEFRPYRTGIAVLKALRELYPEEFRWRIGYEFVSDIPAIDLLTGGSTIRQMIDQGVVLEEIVSSFEEEEVKFRDWRKEYFLY